jgi:cytochrome c oxidase subunit 2
VIVLLLDLGVDFAGGSAFEAVKGHDPDADVRVRIAGEQFAWNVTYPGPDAVFDTPDDITSLFEIHVPVDATVGVTLRSKDVIHSFFVPQLRLKQDALPGREIPVWFEVTEPGQYEILCAELCGFGHYKMRGLLTVHGAEDYEAWLRETWPVSSTDVE